MEKKRLRLSDMLKNKQPRKKARIEEEEVKVAKEEDSTKDMNHIIDNPGFHHILENTFLRLDLKDLLKCQLINKSVKGILDNPMFWIKKLAQKGFSKKNQADWIRGIQIIKKNQPSSPWIDLEEMNLYLKRILNNQLLIDTPCYFDQNDISFKIDNLNASGKNIDPANPLLGETSSGAFSSLAVRAKMRKAIHASFQTISKSDNAGRIQSMVDYLSMALSNGEATQIEEFIANIICIAADTGHLEVIKALLPLTKNPNAEGDRGMTPILMATIKGHTDVIKCLAPLSNNTNTPYVMPPTQNGTRRAMTPILVAANSGNTDIVKILAPLTENPNDDCGSGVFPIEMAVLRGHDEIVRILQSYQK